VKLNQRKQNLKHPKLLRVLLFLVLKIFRHVKCIYLTVNPTCLLVVTCREADMREVSEKTNSRVAWFSIMSLGVCIVVSVLQLWHLKRYFQKKKLI